MSDLEQLRQPWESDEHWELRKEFLEVHKEKFPEDRLLCLAQVYANVELMGCTYPDQVMRQVCELAKEFKVSKKLREERQERAKLNFVKAEEEKAKKSEKRGWDDSSSYQSKFSKSWGGQNSYNRNSYQQNSYQSYNSAIPSYSTSGTGGFGNSRQGETFPFSPTTPKLVVKGGGERGYQDGSNFRPSNTRTLLPAPSIQSHQQLDAKFNRLSELVQIEVRKQPNELQLIQVCTSKAHMKSLWTFDIMPEKRGQGQPKRNPTFVCRLFVDGILTGTATSQSKKSAKGAAYSNAVFRLMNPPVWVVQSCDGTSELLCKGLDMPLRNLLPKGPPPAALEGEIDNTMEQEHCVESGDPFRDLILINDLDINPTSNEISVLMNSASFNRIPCSFQFGTVQKDNQQLIRCMVMLGGQQVGEGFGETKQVAKLDSCKVALVNLQEVAYTVKIRQMICDGGQQISKNQIGGDQVPSNALTSENLGFKMLKMMGWTGGGVGKEGNTGRTEPVSLEDVYHRSGLGYSEERGVSKKFIASVEEIVSNFAKAGTSVDLAFSPEFSKEERQKIHSIAEKFHLKSVSRGGQGTGRHIVLSRRFSPQQLLRHVLEAGGATDKYELVHPTR